jgi:hypothetical protein
MGRTAKEKLRNYRYTPDGKMIVSGSLEELPLECCYDKLPNIKKANILVEYTEEQISEIAKCATDIEYFARKYVYVIDPDKGRVLCFLRPYQLRMLKAYTENRFVVTKSGRQSGKSMTAAIFILHTSLFNRDKKSAILANKLATAKDILEKLKMSYRLLPYWIQVGVKEWHKTSIQLDNECHIFASATSQDAIVGLTVNGILYIDEYAKIRRNIIDAFLDTVFPTVSASTQSKIIVTSTSRGLNHFYELWKKAIGKRNEFFPVEVLWDEVPGRDEAFKQKVIKNKSLQHFLQEYACEFLGSSSTLISGSILSGLEPKEPIQIFKDGKLKIYQFPVLDKTRDGIVFKGRTYVCGIDTSKGTGNDSSVIQVLDITSYPFKQVAIYRSNDTITRSFAEVVHDLAVKYNNAYVMIENNDIGQAVVDYIWHDVEYENLVNYSPSKTRDIGIRSTKKTKSLACDLLQLFMQEFKIEIVDSDTIFELSKFVELRPGKFGAEEGENDDCVTALLWALFILKTNYLNEEDIKKDEKVDNIVKNLVDEGEEEMHSEGEEPVDFIIK